MVTENADTSDADANCETETLVFSTVVSGTDGAYSCACWFVERDNGEGLLRHDARS